MKDAFQLAAYESAWLMAIHMTWMFGLVFILSKRIRNTFYKRALWRSSFIASLLLILLTFSGLHHWNWMPQTILLKPDQQTESQPHWQPMVLVEESTPKNSLPTEETATSENSIESNTNQYTSTVISFLLELWFSVGVILWGFMLVNALFWRLRLANHAKPASKSLKDVFAQASQQMNFSRSPALIESPWASSPLVMGCIKPVIAFPEQYATHYNISEQHLIMCHEIAHLREKDGWWQCLANLVCITLWWHPLVWIARQSLRQSAEETADTLSAQHTQDREQLAACLVRIGKELSSVKWSGSLSIFGAGFRSQLGKRVQRLLHPHSKTNLRPTFFGMLATRLLAPVLLIGIIFGTSSWLGLNSSQSVTETMQGSVFGMMLHAESSHGIADGETSHSSTTSTEENAQPHTSSEHRTIVSTSTEERLKSIIIPTFTHQTIIRPPTQKNDVFNGEQLRQCLTNLNKLRVSILKVDPTWDKLTFQLRMPTGAAQTIDQIQNHVIKTGEVTVIKSGPLSGMPQDIPPFNRLHHEAISHVHSNNSGVPSVNAVGYVNLVNKSAYDLLFRIMLPFDIKGQHHFSENVVVFDLNPTDAEEAPVYTNMPIPSTDESDRGNKTDSTTGEPASDKLYTRAYKLNPDTFLQRIKAVTGFESTDSNETIQDVQKTVQKLFINLGIDVQIAQTRAHSQNGLGGFPQSVDSPTLNENISQDSKAVFFNDRNGTLFVRATAQDLEILEAALSVLQDQGERNTRIGIDMHVVQLDENGIKVLDEFGFNKPTSEDTNHFERIIDTDTMERLLLRLNLGTGIDLLQSPKVTTMNGRLTQLKAQETRLIVTRQDAGHIETNEIATGPTLSVTPNLRPDGKMNIAVHFQLLEFLGYDDPGDFQIISSENEKSNGLPSDELQPVALEIYEQILNEIEVSGTEDPAQVILKHIPAQQPLAFLNKERNDLRKQHEALLKTVSKNAKDLNQTKRQIAQSKELIKSLEEKFTVEVNRTIQQIRDKVLQLASTSTIHRQSNAKIQDSTVRENMITSQSTSRTDPLPLPRFKNLELNSQTSIESGQTLIMGGLKSTHTVKWKNKVPVMSKIPFIGNMFRKEGTETREQYIYILITPRILE